MNTPDQQIISQLDPQRAARLAILAGAPISANTAAQLEARGINVGELEARLIQNMAFR